MGVLEVLGRVLAAFAILILFRILAYHALKIGLDPSSTDYWDAEEKAGVLFKAMCCIVGVYLVYFVASLIAGPP